MQLKNLATSEPSEPVTLQEAKDFARVKSSTEDTLISKYITAARTKAEQVLGRSLVAHSYQVEVSEHDGEVYLPYPPTGTVTKVEYRDSTNTWNELTLNDGYYVLGLTDITISVYPYYQHIRVTYTTTAYSNQDVLRLVKELITIYYDNRPDLEEQEKIVVEKIAKYKIWQAT